MEALEDIRQKRLQFFTKYVIKTEKAQTNEVIDNNLNKTVNFLQEDKAEKQNVITSTLPNPIDLKIDLNSAEIIRKLFEPDSIDKKTVYNQSNSLDDSKSVFKNNRKLEEFKNIVETSYQNHVLSKTENNDLQASRRHSLNLSFQAWNLASHDESLKQTSSTVSSFQAESTNNFETDKIETVTNVNCKIPYMSAYNIYEKPSENQITLEKLFDSVPEPKKLTSQGSSLNTSPTSLSSSGSIKIEPHNLIEVKPPETPKTSNLTFRKNLIKKNPLQNESNRNSVDLSSMVTPKILQNPLEFTLPPKKSNQLPSLKLNENNQDNLDKFFNSKPRNSEHKKKTRKAPKRNKNIFNYLEDMMDEDDDFVHDHSDDENTLDIFSSEEDSLEINKNKPNLKIDLAQLNTSDDDDDCGKDFDFNEPPSECYDDEKVDRVEPFINNTTRQQIKPDIIPNLMLDQIDDDRSLSVAVSLAKSMCKEIDYQKEMEAIFHEQKSEIVKKLPKKPIVQLNELKLSGRFSKNSNDKQDVIKNQLRSSSKTNLLKPPVSSRVSSATNPDKPNLLRSKTVLGKNQEIQSDENVLNEIIDLQKTVPKKSTENVFIQSIELFQTNNKKMSTSSQNENKNKIPQVYQSRAPIWQSSTKNLKRPSSATKIQTNKSLQVPNRPPSAGLFLTYSKLIEIESNIQKNENDQQRPKTALSKLNSLDSQSERKFETTAQEDIKESEFISCRDDWQDLPHEIWLKILGFLNHKDLIQFGRTCKTFHTLYTDSSLWRRVELKYKYNMRNEWLEWIGKRRPNELNIVQCSGNITLSGISEMFRNIGNNLKKLNLSRCSNGSLSGDNFALQASIRCPNVTSLDLSWTLLSNQTLKLIVDSFKKIESINLSGCNMIQEDGFNQLLMKHGENLKNLEISGCIHFSSDIILNIGAYCRGLERLNISNCHRMTNEAIIEACPQWLKLKSLDLRGIKNIKNNCVSTLVRRCPNLDGLSLGECVHIGDSSILEIATYRPNVKHLDLNNCKKISDVAIRSMSPVCNKLEFLNLKGTSVTDTGLITLSNSKFIKSIEDLNLSFLPLSEFVLVKLLKNAEKMKRVHLYGCYNIKHLEDIKNSIEDGRSVEINI